MELIDKEYVLKELGYQIEVMRRIFDDTKKILSELSDKYNDLQTQIALDIEIQIIEEGERERYFMNEYDAIKREWEEQQWV